MRRREFIAGLGGAAAWPIQAIITKAQSVTLSTVLTSTLAFWLIAGRPKIE
jgi:hypothetical protein